MKYVDNSLQKFGEFHQLIEKGVQITRSVAEDCEETEAGGEAVNELRTVMIQLAAMEREINQCVDAATKAKAEFLTAINEDVENSVPLPQLDSLFDKHLTELQSKNDDKSLESVKHVSDFTKTVWNQHHGAATVESSQRDGEDEDEDVVMTETESQVNFTCPITKLEFVDPVSSRVCGHTFSRGAIEAHMKRMKEKARCPMLGCKNILTLEQMEENTVLAYQIKQAKRK